ncbi:MAG: esterase [Acidimicrobiia bacterium]|nr:esterase [Acidimicrobiia bacterium]
MAKRLFLGVLLGFLVLSGCHFDRARAALAGDTPKTITVDGRLRMYWVHVPTGARRPGLPVVFLLHGGGGTAEGMERIAHYNKVADAHGVLAVYPQGWRRSWNDGRPNTPAAQAGVDDVKFLGTLIDQLSSDYGIDRTRVFASGLSNGAFMSQRLGCELANRIKAIAPVAGTMGTGHAPMCHPSGPESILEIHGTDDPLIPFNGGQDRGRDGGTTDVSVMDTYNFWVSTDGCATPTVSPVPDTANDGTTTTVHTTRPCTNGSAALLYVVNGGGHTWPGGEQYFPVALVGKTSRDFDASETITRFFLSF